MKALVVIVLVALISYGVQGIAAASSGVKTVQKSLDRIHAVEDALK